MALVEGDARARGMTKLWAKARAPEFYRRIGFRIVREDEKAPKTLDGCIGCPQFRTSCNPAIVIRELKDRDGVL